MTRSPTDAWTAQQLREATPYGQTPKYLIRDHDRKFGACFARVANTSGIKMLITPSHTPRANAVCERFLGSVRREVSITCSSFRRSNWIVSFMPMSNTSIASGRIRHRATDSRTV